ncbi:MAG: 4-hydroxy-tetrahydrodipicolinate synthase [Tissierellaceae bacterium]|jgi:4-hydroxy-tetrahydrodipicolinate synthase|nr:4-hydroxy-tetrahydrodipicolinate synthase [Tissierellia bacterium]
MTIFKGSGVAIVTPFNEDGTINYEELARLLEFQIENQTDAIIIAGTTGEASTLTDEEQLALIDFTVKKVDGRIPVIAGTGSNDTRHGISLSVEASKLGVDGLLMVTPYYNKCTQGGLIKHFTAMAEKVDVPIILYSVPGRTQVNIEPETVYELSKVDNIVGLKDATGDLAYAVEVMRLCGPDFALYSGNDDIIVPILSVGGVGVISVLANVVPKETHDMVDFYLQGRVKESAALQLKYKPLIDALFAEVNPIPVKKALELMDYKVGSLRLPLTEATLATTARLEELMKEAGLI